MKIECDVKNYRNWCRELFKSYGCLLCSTFRPKNSLYFWDNKSQKIVNYIVPENVFIDCPHGSMHIYDTPDHLPSKIKFNYIRNGRWYKKHLGSQKRFIVQSFTYTLSNASFLNNIHRVISKFCNDKSFYAVIVLTDIYPNQDEIYGGMGFFCTDNN